MPQFDRKGIKTNNIGTRAQLKKNLDYSSHNLKLRKLTQYNDNPVKIFGGETSQQGADIENIKAMSGHHDYMNKFSIIKGFNQSFKSDTVAPKAFNHELRSKFEKPETPYEVSRYVFESTKKYIKHSYLHPQKKVKNPKLDSVILGI
jgi:hypothetical protein